MSSSEDLQKLKERRGCWRTYSWWFGTTTILLRAAEIYRELRRRGVTISDADILIGATAIVKNMPLWTRNVRHLTPLADFGLKLYREGPRPP